MATWLSAPSSHKPPDDDHHNHSLAREMFNGLLKGTSSRPHTPASFKVRSHYGGSQSGQIPVEAEPSIEEDPQVVKFRDLYDATESKIADLFGSTGEIIVPEKPTKAESTAVVDSDHAQASQSRPTTSKKRKLDDDYDDYDDDDDEEEEEEEEDQAPDTNMSPLKNKISKVQIIAEGTSPPVARPVPIHSRPSSEGAKLLGPKHKEDPEDARKKLEEAKRIETETVKNMSRSLFFTLESDRDAMLDQQRLDEAERRAEAEAEGHASRQNAAMQQGSLSSANLGASSLTLKNLIARIDQRRSEVHATESELRALMSEVRKNRSKWASEDKVGQEELYEAAEKVLNELKAQTEHSTPFLNAVKKKDAPDYFQVIRQPMDLGTMTKKLKQYSYKSKQDFVDDLHLVWANCLKYNSAPEHPIRKHALFMRKETDKLVPLIPEIVIRDRAEYEAEERRQRIANGEFDDNAEESDDDQPIMASRGRKAPAKSTMKAPNAGRKSTAPESTPNPESKPLLSQMTSLSNGVRADSEFDGSQGHGTPPPGMLTPVGGDKGFGSIADAGSDALESDIPGLPASVIAPEVEDEDYRLWKQKTKKERAMVAAARHKLFRGDKLNAEEDALLRTRAGMRRWQRLQNGSADQELGLGDAEGVKAGNLPNGQSLAEGMEVEEESMLPDYYDPVSAIPDIDPRLRWEHDSEGNVIDHSEEYLRLYPRGNFLAPVGRFSKKVDQNMHQIQDTRKVVSKISVVKQMQIQAQVYQNQFQKFEPPPFVETDIDDHVMSDEGPLMAPWVCKAALQRSIGKVFFHAGFEEFQPSALDTVTDIVGDFFQKMCTTLANFQTEDKIAVSTTILNPVTQKHETKTSYKSPCTNEEAILHTIHESGLSVNDLEYFAHDEIDRLSTRLDTMFERMRAHYAELLRPALSDDTAQGHGAFDSGEQFVSGDFAADLDEDFFGFRALGLEKDFGMIGLSTVPLHLLHNRLSTAAQTNTIGTGEDEKLFKPPAAWPRVNVETIEGEIGLVKDFFRKKLRDNGDRPLVEDLELPLKQRRGYGRARVPASGKIGDGKVGGPLGGSPMKKPPPGKLQNGIKSNSALNNSAGLSGDKKKKSVVDAENNSQLVNGIDSSPEKKVVQKAKMNGGEVKAVNKLGRDNEQDGDKEGEGTNGEVKMNGIREVDGDSAMMSPESL